MADTFSKRIIALKPGNESKFWGPGIHRSWDEETSYNDGFSHARMEAEAIATEADAEIARITRIATEVASTAADQMTAAAARLAAYARADEAMDPEIDPGLPLHERIAVLKMQRDAFADFASKVCTAIGHDGEGASDDMLEEVKAMADIATEAYRVISKQLAANDVLRERLAIAEAELANLRGVPEQWRKACEERDAARSIAAAITGYPFDMLVGRYKADDAAASEAFHRTVRETLKYQDDERGFDLTTLNLGGDPPHGIEKAGQVDDFAGIMDGPEMMPIESDEEPRR